MGGKTVQCYFSFTFIDYFFLIDFSSSIFGLLGCHTSSVCSYCHFGVIINISLQSYNYNEDRTNNSLDPLQVKSSGFILTQGPL